MKRYFESANFAINTICFCALAAVTTPLQAQAPDTVLERYGDWVVECNTIVVADTTEAACQAYQELRQDQTGQRVLLVSMTNGETDEFVNLSMIVPFGLDIKSDIVITSASVEIARLDFTTCLPAGCLADAVLSVDAVAMLAKNPSAQVVMPTTNANGVFAIDISTLGFDAAIGRLGLAAR